MLHQPKFWKTNNIISHLLTPISLIFLFLGKTKKLFEKNYKSKVPIICVGNITIGGSGKTPTVLYIANLLNNLNYKSIILLKGYGGTLKTPTKIDSKHTSSEVGDEAILHSKFNETWICRSRWKAVKQIEKMNTGNLILMDDGIQNNSVLQDFKILVFDGNEGIGNGRVIPSGPLREKFENGLKDIDIAIIIGEDRNNISKKIFKINNRVKIFKSIFEPDIKTINYLKGKNIITFSGIGFPKKFFATLKDKKLNLIETICFQDHHKYQKSELEDLIKISKLKNGQLVTTEKDFVKINEIDKNLNKKIVPLPVKLKVLKEKELIEELTKVLYEKKLY